MAKTLDYDFTAPQFNGTTGIEAQTGPDLTVTRASDATVMDYFNVLKTVNDNEPRFTGGRRVENLVTYSSTFDNAAWADLNSTQTSGEDDPFGGTDAYLLVDDATSGFHGITNDVLNYEIVSGNTYTFSYYAKANSNTAARIGIASTGTYYVYHSVNLSTGATAAALNSQWDAGVCTATDVGNGWYRIVLTSTFGGPTHTWQTSGGLDIRCEKPYQTTTYSGSGESIYIYGAQFEDVTGQDDPAPSEYIATTTAAKAQWYATKRRTNLISQSQEIAHASDDWTGALVVTALNDAVAPDGTTTASRLDDNTTSGIHKLTHDGTVTTITGNTVTQSIYAKAGTATRIMLYQPATNTGCGFDLSDGTTFLPASIGGYADTYSIEAASVTYPSAPAGWYRCQITTVATATSSLHAAIYCIDGATTTWFNYAGNGDSVYLWGAQYEYSSTATAYIATTDTVASSSFDTAITPTGLLIEEERTNIQVYSQAMDSWTANLVNTTGVYDVATAPDGTLTADKILDNAATGTGDPHYRYNATVSTSTAYTFSVYAKADQTNFLYIFGRLFTTPANGGVWFDLSTGAVGTEETGWSGAIENAGNGWYRCSVTFTTDATDTLGQFRLVLDDADNGGGSVTLDGTNSIFVWGAQLEAGAFPTSYIPNLTTGSTTRNAERINALSVTEFNVTAGTMYTEFDRYSGAEDGPVNGLTYSMVGYTGGTIWYGIRHSSNKPGWFVRDGDTQALITVSDADRDHKVAGGAAVDDFACYVDGVAGTPDTSGTPPSLASATLDIGNYSNNYWLNGHMQRAVFWDERLDDATLEDLSNGTFPSAQFPGTVAGDGGHIWPPRANDPRWTQIISDSGITASGNFIDDVHAALEALGSTTGQLDDLWKKVKAANSVTDTSEPYLY